MTPEQQRLFRLVGVFAEESLITADAAAVIWGLDHANAAQNKLFELADLAFLAEIEDTTTASTSFRQHGLLRVYAQALLETANELPQDQPQACSVLYRSQLASLNETPESHTLLDQQTPNLLAALQWTEHNDPSLFSSLVNILSNFLLIRGQLALLETYLPKAVTAAARTVKNS